jgi:hypothetical protein
MTSLNIASAIALNKAGVSWCISHPIDVLHYHAQGSHFLLVHPDHGVVFAGQDADELTERLQVMRPSVRASLWATVTSLWVLSPPVEWS